MNILQAFSMMVDKGAIIYRTGDKWKPQLQCVNGCLYRRSSGNTDWYIAVSPQFSFEDVNADDWEVRNEG